MQQSPTTPCPACGGYDMSVFLDLPKVPVYCNILWETAESAGNAPRAPIRLAHCPACGMIYNVAFDPHLMHYNGAYDNTLQFSPRFQSHAQRLCRYLIDRYDLHHKHIIEIGCGDAGVLAMLCRFGPNEATGFDPAYVPTHAASAEGMRILPELYGEQHAHLPVDLVLCRHVLEHVPSPLHFLASLRRILGDRRDTTVFFGMPNGLKMLRDAGIWDVIYEHCSYFTPASLERLFVLAGFEPIRVCERYEGQFLDIESRLASPAATYPRPDLDEALPEIQERVAQFAGVYEDVVAFWSQSLAAMAQKRIVIWGAGSKGVMFLNAVGVESESIPYAVDINPRKQGRYIPGTGQRIISPDELRKYRPQVVLVMNPLYKGEISAQLRELGIDADVLAIWCDSQPARAGAMLPARALGRRAVETAGRSQPAAV